MEKYVKAIPFAAIQLCEDCGKGEFLPNGDNSYVPDIKIGHSCNFCGKTAYFNQTYPAIRFEIFRKEEKTFKE